MEKCTFKDSTVRIIFSAEYQFWPNDAKAKNLTVPLDGCINIGDRDANVVHVAVENLCLCLLKILELVVPLPCPRFYIQEA